MTQEDKELLLKDLCARLLPYGVKVLIPECRQDIATLIGVDDKCFVVKYNKSIIYCPFSIVIKPYYRPMSSMTDEEKKEYYTFQYKFTLQVHEYQELNKETFSEYLDWLNRKMFDYRGLIEKGLAIEVTKDNNPYKD